MAKWLGNPSSDRIEGRTGVLVVNLGSPDAPDAPSLRRYLRQFLGDPRVVEIPKLIWWFILNGIILVVRPRKSAHKYASIWMPEGAPLKVITQGLCQKLEQKLRAMGEDLPVVMGMRYGNPSIETGIHTLKQHGCDRILLVPLYPQYSSSTTASVMDDFFVANQRYRHVPMVRVLDPWYRHPDYIEALRQSVQSFWANQGQPEVLVISFHGLPKQFVELGDPYQKQCIETGELLARALGLHAGQYRITFQSRFGPAAWLQPYTEPTVRTLAKGGVSSVQVVCPGFSADCLETLEEIAMEVRTAFLEEGGRVFHYIPALNDSDVWVDALAGMVWSLKGPAE
jgi:ferrochelatase